MQTKRQSQESQVAMFALMKVRKIFHHPKFSKIPNRKHTMKHHLRRVIRQPYIQSRLNSWSKSSRTAQPIWSCNPIRFITI